MSLSRPEPGEYGWQGHEHDALRERTMPKRDWERYGPPQYGLTGGARTEAVEGDRAACRDENARLDAQDS